MDKYLVLHEDGFYRPEDDITFLKRNATVMLGNGKKVKVTSLSTEQLESLLSHHHIDTELKTLTEHLLKERKTPQN